jgi:hypothetical protein
MRLLFPKSLKTKKEPMSRSVRRGWRAAFSRSAVCGREVSGRAIVCTARGRAMKKPKKRKLVREKDVSQLSFRISKNEIFSITERG